MVGERLLERRQLLVAEPLDRRHGAAVGLHGEHRATLHRNAVQVNRARAAAAGVAADVRPGEAEIVAQEVDEQAASRHLAARTSCRSRSP